MRNAPSRLLLQKNVMKYVTNWAIVPLNLLCLYKYQPNFMMMLYLYIN